MFPALAPQLAKTWLPPQLSLHRQQAMHEQLRRHTTRAALLSFLATPNLLAPPLFNQPTLEAIAHHIIEICTEWEWL